MEANYQCPYCWETVETWVDTSVNEQEMVEDCAVCCNPILFRIFFTPPDGIEIQAEPLGQ